MNREEPTCTRQATEHWPCSVQSPGRGQISCSSEPDLFVDGVPCCDQFTAHALTHDGLIRPGRLGLVGQRIPATLTGAGQALLTATATAA
jgi:hypothetical protein